jgi:hypothetical protein
VHNYTAEHVLTFSDVLLTPAGELLETYLNVSGFVFLQRDGFLGVEDAFSTGTISCDCLFPSLSFFSLRHPPFPRVLTFYILILTQNITSHTTWKPSPNPYPTAPR